MGRQPRKDVLEGHRSLVGRFAFELIIIFVGVTAAFALENARAAREEAQYRQQMVSALRANFDEWAIHGKEIDVEISGRLAAFDRKRQNNEEALLPIYREPGGERPPTRAWDGVVATGVARSLDPKLFFRLSLFYERADSFGDRYLRYNDFSEARVLPYVGEPSTFYDNRRQLKPDFAAYVDRLRDLQTENRALVAEAAALRDALPR